MIDDHPNPDHDEDADRNPEHLAVSAAVAWGIAEICLDRPPVNALSASALRDLRHAANHAGYHPAARAVVIRGANGLLSAGADIKEMADMTAEQMAAHAVRLQDAFLAVARIPKPVVAVVEGATLGGGCELALCADHRIAAADARIGLPEILLGVMPGAGGTQRLTRLVGPAHARDLIYTGRQLSAHEAERIGLVDRVVPPGDAVSAAMDWAAQFASGPALALSAAKEAIDHATDIEPGLQRETELFAALFDTDDRLIGMRSFLDDGPGKATFTGR